MRNLGQWEFKKFAQVTHSEQQNWDSNVLLSDPQADAINHYNTLPPARGVKGWGEKDGTKIPGRASPYSIYLRPYAFLRTQRKALLSLSCQLQFPKQFQGKSMS